MHVALCAVAAREVRTPGQARADPRPDVLLHRTPAAHRAAPDPVADDDGAIAQHRTPHPDRDLDGRPLLRARRPVDPVPLPVAASGGVAHRRPGSTRPHRVSCAARARRPACSRSRSRWTNSPTRPASTRVELRLRNDADLDQASGRPWSGKHLRECYRQGAERFGWHARPMAPRALRRGGVQVGWGMATATYPGRRMPAGCRVATTPTDGPVRVGHPRGRQRRTHGDVPGRRGRHRPSAGSGDASTRVTRLSRTRPTAAPRRPPPPSDPLSPGGHRMARPL